MITLIEVSAAVDQLSRVYALPKRAEANLEAFVRTWHQVLGRLTPMQIDGAVKTYLASEERFFPTPGKLLAIARTQFQDIETATDLASQYKAWEQAGYKRHPDATAHSPCPVCAAELAYYVVNATTGNQRLMVLHHADRHRQARIDFVGRAAVGTGGFGLEWAPPTPAPQAAA